MALLTIILFLFGFVLTGLGSGSTSTGDLIPKAQHSIKCSARMGSGESRRDCGGPPANP